MPILIYRSATKRLYACAYRDKKVYTNMVDLQDESEIGRLGRLCLRGLCYVCGNVALWVLSPADLGDFFFADKLQLPWELSRST